jgi:two-component system nitrate/nitrite response regulator NarL
MLIEVKKGLEVCGEAENGLDAIQKTKDLLPDLVLLDLRMPVMNGLRAAPIIREALPKVHIVLFTIDGNEISETVRTAAHIDVVLKKPDGLDRLLESIQDLVQPN